MAGFEGRGTFSTAAFEARWPLGVANKGQKGLGMTIWRVNLAWINQARLDKSKTPDLPIAISEFSQPLEDMSWNF